MTTLFRQFNALVLSLSLAALAQAQTTQPVAVGVWRTTVEPGGADYVWSAKEQLPALPAALLPCQWGYNEDACDGACITIPANTPVGPLSIAGLATVNVIARPATRPSVLVPASLGDSAPRIQAAWNAGQDVILPSPFYQLYEPLVWPPGANLRDVTEAAVLKRIRSTGDQPNPVIFTGQAPGYGGTISDLTIDCTACPGAAVYYDDQYRQRVNPSFQRLKILRGQLPNINSIGLLLEDVDLVQSGGRIDSSHSLLHNISWNGVPVAGFNELIFGGDQSAIINAVWDNTARGLVLRSGPTNSYFNSLRFRGMTQVGNAGEGILCEDLGGIGAQRNLFAYTQYYDSGGPILNCWQTPFCNNIIKGLDADGCGTHSMVMIATATAPQAGNLFINWEIRNGGKIRIDAGASGNVFAQFAIVNPRPTQGSWAGVGAENYGPQAMVYGTGAAANTFDPATFLVTGLPAGWKVGVNGN